MCISIIIMETELRVSMDVNERDRQRSEDELDGGVSSISSSNQSLSFQSTEHLIPVHPAINDLHTPHAR